MLWGGIDHGHRLAQLAVGSSLSGRWHTDTRYPYVRDTGAMDLEAALSTYDRVALNLDKLDRVWRQMQDLLPDGPFLSDGSSEDEITYHQLAESWARIAASLPAIDGWRITAEVLDYGGIGQARVDYLEIDEPQSLFAFEAAVSAPGTQSAIYRHKLLRARQLLVRQRAQELVSTIDNAVTSVPTAPDLWLDEDATMRMITTVREAFDEIERLLGDGLHGGPRRGDLRRHLHFGKPGDARDIAVSDWPALRPHIEHVLYGDEDPVPVEVEDLAALVTETSPSRVSSRIHWDRLDADGFERLLARLLEQDGSYTDINRPMHVNAPDGGRDIEAFHVVANELLGDRRERVIVQAKHWPKKGISNDEIADLVNAKLPLWEGEPIKGLIIATTGTFTQDAVKWVERHNGKAERPWIKLWAGPDLEAILRKRPAVLAEFGLTG